MHNVSAIIVTRGDVDMIPALDSLPAEWEKIVWNNGARQCWIFPGGDLRVSEMGIYPYWCDRPPPVGTVGHMELSDLSVYGRYAAIEYASHDLIFTQDDDVIVSDPQAIVDTYHFLRECPDHGELDERKEINGVAGWLCRKHSPIRFSTDALVANMPQEFRHDGYTDSCLVGFGACFHRDAPARAFEKIGYNDYCSPFLSDDHTDITFTRPGWDFTLEFPSTEFVRRTCDVVFTTLTPRVLVDVPKENLPYATDSTRMYRQPGHLDERTRMLHLARQVRDS